MKLVVVGRPARRWPGASPALRGLPSPQSSPRGRGSGIPPTPLDSGPVSGYGQALRGNDAFRGAGVVAWYSESARRILPRCTRPTPTPAGDEPLASRSLRPHYIPLSPLLWIAVAYLGTGRAIAGKTQWGRRVDVGVGIAVGVLSRDVSAWIPACAGMTNGVRRWRTRKPFKRIFVPMTK